MSLILQRRTALGWLALPAASVGLASLSAPARAQVDDSPSLRSGKLFISSNALAGNEVLVYARANTGAPTLLGRHPTQGTGTGAALGSQGALCLSRSGQHLFVVNAASATVSTFSLTGGAVTLRSVVPSGGQGPTSVTEWGGIVYVLNAGGNGNLAGFRHSDGVLTPLLDGVRGLSQAGGTAPAQVSFSHYGDVLVVSERATHRLTSYSVLAGGVLARQAVTASAGNTPFGFAFTANDTLVVSEATASGASSYRFVDNSRLDAPRVVTPALGNGQGAACWLAVSPNGRFAFSANAGTSNISRYGVARDGRLTLQAGAAASNGSNTGSLDLAVSPDGEQLLVLAPRAPQVNSYAIGSDGSLTPLGVVAGVPVGAAGLVVN